MELVNSGAQQSDIMAPVRDWFGLLNRGFYLTPVGSSDSHDVSRYIVGQGRTYIRCRDDRPGEIDVKEAVESFLAGRVLVSCGLLADIRVNDKYGPGELALSADEVKVSVRVLGPSWATAEKVELFANGAKIREAAITDGKKAGLKSEHVWKLPRFRHDVHLVAVASGPGVVDLYWPIAKPYQPTSPVLNRRVLGITGAVWIDGDRDGKKSRAFDDARRLGEESKADLAKLIPILSDYDEAVAAQVASILQSRSISLAAAEIQEAAKNAGPQVERGIQAFQEAWRECQIARSRRKD